MHSKKKSMREREKCLNFCLIREQQGLRNNLNKNTHTQSFDFSVSLEANYLNKKREHYF